MKIQELRKIIERYISNREVNNEFETKLFWDESFKILSEDLNFTIDYLNTCDSEEFEVISEIFDDLSEHFKSQQLINCMEENAIRTDVDCKIDIEYAKMNLK